MSWAARWRVVALFVLAGALSGFTILRGISPHDEGLMLQAGTRIASGEWPYRDFWSNYPPGQEVVLALLHDIFGASLLAWRVLRTLIDAGVSVLAYVLVRRALESGVTTRSREAYALLAWLAGAGAMAFPTGPGPNPPALLLSLGALVVACGEGPAGAQAPSARTLEVQPASDRPDCQSSGGVRVVRPGAPVLAGALAGLAFCFRFELGLAAIVGVLIALPERPARKRAALAAAAMALVPLAPFFAAAPAAMLHDTFGFYGIQGLQRLPFPLHFHGALKPSKLIEFYIPLILVVGCAVWVAALAAAIRARAVARLELALVPLTLVSLAYLLGRTDEFHLVPLSVVVALGLAVTGARAPIAPRAVLSTVLALIALHGLDRRAGQLLHPPAAAAVSGAAGDGVQTTPQDAQALSALERTLGHLTRPGEPIFVADPRHDLVHAGDPLLYAILGHPNPTRYDVMQPGLVTTASVQREIIRSLQRSRTRVVIRWLDPRASLHEPNGAGHSSGVHLLDRYLDSHFQPYTRYGVYQVLTVRR